MKLLLALGLVLVSSAIAVDAEECLRQRPVDPENVCSPPLNALIFQGRSVVRCCENQSLYPIVLSSEPIPNTNILRCDCVPRAELCALQPERCNEGVPKQRYIRFVEDQTSIPQ